jgi:hypothetical protein
MAVGTIAKSARRFGPVAPALSDAHEDSTNTTDQQHPVEDSVKVVDFRADYEVGSNDVLLTIVIGNAQIGSSIVKLGAEKGRGEINKLLIGSGPSIKGKALKTKSVVTDVSDKTNRTSIIYRLTGGKRDQDFMSSGTVDENGDSIIYRALFKLV